MNALSGSRGNVLRLGTRASQLALAQATQVAQAIHDKSGYLVELVHISTAGDRSSAPISELVGTANTGANSGVGVFTSALREALLADEVDLAVHSFKDLPTARQDKIIIAAIPPREDPRDVLISQNNSLFADLPTGAQIGTSAPRRIAQLLATRPDIVCVPLRGNVDSRLRRVAAGELDAIVLARAGLARLDRLAEISETFSPDVVTPAPAQGALAVECRSTDIELIELLAALDDVTTRAAVTAERSLLATLEAGCTAPVGAFAEVCEVFGEAHLHLHAAVIALDGSQAVRRSFSIPLHTAVTSAASLGQRLAVELLDAGATALMGVAR